MKTVLDRLPVQIEEGKSLTIALPEAFRLGDGLFLLVHNSLGETIQVTLTGEGGEKLSHSFKLNTFPAILVFPQDSSDQEKITYTSVCISAFQGLEGSLTFRSKNPPHILRAYQQ